VPLVIGTAVAAVPFGVLTFAHESKWEIYLALALFGVGVGLALAAMANLIVDAVPPEQTGVASGMHMIMRMIGSAVGAQVSASVVASSVIAGYPTDTGFTIAFALMCGVFLLALAASLLVPARATREAHTARGSTMAAAAD
jgi:MFS family permease